MKILYFPKNSLNILLNQIKSNTLEEGSGNT